MTKSNNPFLRYRNRKPTKYKNTKVGGYDSKKEARRANQLKLMQQAGIITSLQEQVRYELIPSQYKVIDGKKKCVERSCHYVADFVYKKDGELIVEDTKGFRTPDYIIKRKLMLYIHGIKIQEI